MGQGRKGLGVRGRTVEEDLSQTIVAHGKQIQSEEMRNRTVTEEVVKESAEFSGTWTCSTWSARKSIS